MSWADFLDPTAPSAPHHLPALNPLPRAASGRMCQKQLSGIVFCWLQTEPFVSAQGRDRLKPGTTANNWNQEPLQTTGTTNNWNQQQLQTHLVGPSWDWALGWTHSGSPFRLGTFPALLFQRGWCWGSSSSAGTGLSHSRAALEPFPSPHLTPPSSQQTPNAPTRGTGTCCWSSPKEQRPSAERADPPLRYRIELLEQILHWNT